MLFCETYLSPASNNIILTLLHVTPTTLLHATSIPPTFLLGCVLLAAGASLRALCYYYQGNNFTFQLALRQEHSLCTDGPYSIVRHPSYTGIILCLIGHTMCILGPGSWWAESGGYRSPMGKLVITVWTLIVCLLLSMIFTRVPKEDRVMRESFGMQWVEWAGRTPSAVIPFVY